MPPFRGIKNHLEFNTVKRSNGAAQVVESFEPRHRQVLLSIRLLMQIPSASPHAIPGEEDGNLWPARACRRQRHANTQCLALVEFVREVLATPSIIDVFASIIAMDTQAAAVPAGKAEGRIWECRKANGYRVVAAAAKNLDLVVYGLGAAGSGWVVFIHEVQGRVANDAPVG